MAAAAGGQIRFPWAATAAAAARGVTVAPGAVARSTAAEPSTPPNRLLTATRPAAAPVARAVSAAMATCTRSPRASTAAVPAVVGVPAVPAEKPAAVGSTSPPGGRCPSSACSLPRTPWSEVWAVPGRLAMMASRVLRARVRTTRTAAMAEEEAPEALAELPWVPRSSARPRRRRLQRARCVPIPRTAATAEPPATVAAAGRAPVREMAATAETVESVASEEQRTAAAWRALAASSAAKSRPAPPPGVPADAAATVGRTEASTSPPPRPIGAPWAAAAKAEPAVWPADRPRPREAPSPWRTAPCPATPYRAAPQAMEAMRPAATFCSTSVSGPTAMAATAARAKAVEFGSLREPAAR